MKWAGPAKRRPLLKWWFFKKVENLSSTSKNVAKTYQNLVKYDEPYVKKEFVNHFFLPGNDNKKSQKCKNARLIQKILQTLEKDNGQVASPPHFDPYFHFSTFLVFQNRLTGLTAGFTAKNLPICVNPSSMITQKNTFKSS